MRLVIAYVQPFVADRVADALHRVSGVTGATFVDARGFGRGRVGEAPSAEGILGTVPRVRVEVGVRDGCEEAVVRAISAAAHTGRRGDGKVYVLPLDQATRISTGEEGEAAV